MSGYSRVRRPGPGNAHSGTGLQPSPRPTTFEEEPELPVGRLVSEAPGSRYGTAKSLAQSGWVYPRPEVALEADVYVHLREGLEVEEKQDSHITVLLVKREGAHPAV